MQAIVAIYHIKGNFKSSQAEVNIFLRQPLVNRDYVQRIDVVFIFSQRELKGWIESHRDVDFYRCQLIELMRARDNNFGRKSFSSLGTYIYWACPNRYMTEASTRHNLIKYWPLCKVLIPLEWISWKCKWWLWNSEKAFMKLWNRKLPTHLLLRQIRGPKFSWPLKTETEIHHQNWTPP